ncbi:MAG: hypothetical protein LBT38_08740 [Deltaproteobacteria bacterium]|jgi:RNA recognition motif-containing protein|nr:hypothetical protein [Deltaproteobacteria bacterium]
MIDLFVANFPYDTERSELDTIFSRFGEVESVKIITDRSTGCSRGFGFVRMAKDGATAAVAALNQAIFGGRPLRVRLANPIQPRFAPNNQKFGDGSNQGYDQPQNYHQRGQSYNQGQGYNQAHNQAYDRQDYNANPDYNNRDYNSRDYNSNPEYNNRDYNSRDYNQTPDYNSRDYNSQDYNNQDYNNQNYNQPGYAPRRSANYRN